MVKHNVRKKVSERVGRVGTLYVKVATKPYDQIVMKL